MLNLVTGGSGFIGAHIIAALRRRGEDVRGFDLRRPKNAPDGVEVFQGSVTDVGAVARAMDGVDAVFHTAANAHLWAADKTEFETVNVMGTRIVLEEARRAGVKRVVHTSSSTVLMGRRAHGGTVDETLLLGESDMAGPYPRSKLKAENEVRRAGVDAVIVLPTVPVGPGDWGRTAPTQMILDFIRRRTPAYLDATLNLIDVRDVAEGHVLARDKGKTGERYLLGHRTMKLSELFAVLAGLTGIPAPKRRVPYGVALAAAALSETWADVVSKRPPRASYTGVLLAGVPVTFSAAKAIAALGLPQSPIEGALKDEIQWLRERGWISS